MTHPVLMRRKAEREALVDIARCRAKVAGPLVDAQAVVMIAPVARGDFKNWSDIDVLVIADELARRRRHGNEPIANHAAADGAGVVVYGDLASEGIAGDGVEQLDGGGFDP